MELSRIEEIERAISALTTQERLELYERLDQSYAQLIDARLGSDLAAGRLDAAISRAFEDDRNGRTRPL
jgi:hypothetical protein